MWLRVVLLSGQELIVLTTRATSRSCERRKCKKQKLVNITHLGLLKPALSDRTGQARKVIYRKSKESGFGAWLKRKGQEVAVNSIELSKFKMVPRRRHPPLVVINCFTIGSHSRKLSKPTAIIHNTFDYVHNVLYLPGMYRAGTCTAYSRLQLRWFFRASENPSRSTLRWEYHVPTLSSRGRSRADNGSDPW